MSQVNYKQYVKKTMQLARSLIIKSESSAEQLNDYLKLMGHSVPDEHPHTWKYYLNLSGEYFPPLGSIDRELNKPLQDQLMQVISLDDYTTIDFTLAGLVGHPITRREYGYNGEYYLTLVNQFPAQEMLIRGIINPVDIEEALNAPDFFYPSM